MSLPLLWRTISATTLALALAACANTFKPAPEANAVPALGPTAATVSTSNPLGSADNAGVRVTTLSVGDWPGVYDIQDEVTPLKVRIENNSQAPLAVRVDRFTLSSAKGDLFRALPLYKIDGEGTARLSITGASPITSPGFAYSEFAVAPYFGSVYPGITPYGATGFYSGSGYGLYDTYFVRRDLPTPEMLRRAIPEGVLNPGGYVEGFLFFEKVPKDVDRVTFEYQLTNADTGQSSGALAIPYVVS